MNILLVNKLNSFASDVMCDVTAHFMRNVYFNETEYTSQRSVFYSMYGQKTLIQRLYDLPLEFFIELDNYSKSKIIDNAVFDEIVSTIIKKSGWNSCDHATFFETCGKVLIFGIVAMEYGCFNWNKMHEEIVKMAKKAFAFNILDEHYDTARKTAQSMIYTVFRIQGTDLNEFVTQVEKEIGFEEFFFPEGLSNLITTLGPHTDSILSSSDNFKVMNRTKFDFLVYKAIEKFKRSKNEANRNNDTSNLLKHFSVLVIQVGCISLYCAKNSFKEAVQRGFDCMTVIILTEKRLSFATKAK